MQSLIGFLNSHEGFYIGLCYASLALALGLGVRAWWPAWLDAVAGTCGKRVAGESSEIGERRAVFFLLALGMAVVLFRLPVILTERVLQLDECLQVVGGWSLLHDPVPWRGSDNNTSGPLNMYALTAALAIGLPPKLITARLVMVALGLVLVGCIYFTLLKLNGQLAAVPAAVAMGLFECLTRDPNHAHYNSEAVSVALLAAALLCYVSGWPRRFASGIPANRAPSTTHSTLRLPLIYASGLLLGAVPYAKLQAAPLGCFWAVVFASDLWRNRPSAPANRAAFLALGAGGVTVPYLMSLVLAVTGAWHDFVTSYFGFAHNYGFHSMPLFLAVSNPFTGPDMPWFLLYCAAVVLGPFVCLGKTHASPSRGFRLMLGVFLCYLAVAVLVIIAPRTGFQHYSAFVLHPVALLLGVCVSRVATLLATSDSPQRQLARRVAAGSVCFATAGLMAAHVAGLFVVMPPQEDFFPTVVCAPRRVWVPFFPVRTGETSPTASFIAHHVRPGDRMSVWGWAPNYYVFSGVPNATREPTTITAMPPTDLTSGIGAPLREYYRARYLGDLCRARPVFFVDAVCSSEFLCNDRRTMGHEAWPELAKFVAENYVKAFEREVAPGDGTRVYMLKESAPAEATH